MANYENNLGVNALTLEDINKQYGINASKDYAKQEADRLLQSNLQAVNAQRTQQKQGAYQQSRQKDLSYFDQFQNSRYNTAGRGLTGGLQLGMQKSLEQSRNQDLADIYSNLNSSMQKYDADEGRYRNEATSYADQLYNTNLTKAQDLIGSDFSRRLAIAQEEYERQIEEEEMRRALEEQEYNRKFKAEEILRAEQQRAFENKMAEAYLEIARRNALGGGSSGGGGGSSRSSGVPSKTTGDPNQDALINYIAQKAEERRTTNLPKGTTSTASTGSKYATTAYNPSKSYIANKYNVPDKVVSSPYTRTPIRNLAR